jgi:hypothetical protein
MPTNLVSVVMQFLTPEMIAKIASALGLDPNVVQKAIGGAVPTLLSSLSDVASTPNGARQLTNVLTQQQSGSLDTLKGLIGSSAQGTLVQSGSNLLSGLFGGGTMDTMAQSIGKFAGVDPGAGKSVLGVLGPVVLGVLGQQQRSTGMDASGLASLLSSQKGQIAAAIPSALADHLSAAGLIDRATGSLRSATSAASATGGRIAGAAQQTMKGAGQAAYAPTRSAPSQWSYWLIGLAVLGGIAWYALGRTGEKVAELPRPAPIPSATVGVAPTDPRIGGVSLTNHLNSWLDALRSTLPGITDATSAQQALPILQEATVQLNEVRKLAPALTPDGKRALTKLIAEATPTINQLCDKALATPGTADILKPSIDALRGSLDTLSRA